METNHNFLKNISLSILLFIVGFVVVLLNTASANALVGMGTLKKTEFTPNSSSIHGWGSYRITGNTCDTNWLGYGKKCTVTLTLEKNGGVCNSVDMVMTFTTNTAKSFTSKDFGNFAPETSDTAGSYCYFSWGIKVYNFDYHPPEWKSRTVTLPSNCRRKSNGAKTATSLSTRKATAANTVVCTGSSFTFVSGAIDDLAVGILRASGAKGSKVTKTCTSTGYCVLYAQDYAGNLSGNVTELADKYHPAYIYVEPATTSNCTKWENSITSWYALYNGYYVGDVNCRLICIFYDLTVSTATGTTKGRAETCKAGSANISVTRDKTKPYWIDRTINLPSNCVRVNGTSANKNTAYSSPTQTKIATNVIACNGNATLSSTIMGDAESGLIQTTASATCAPGSWCVLYPEDKAGSYPSGGNGNVFATDGGADRYKLTKSLCI